MIDAPRRKAVPSQADSTKSGAAGPGRGIGEAGPDRRESRDPGATQAFPDRDGSVDAQKQPLSGDRHGCPCAVAYYLHDRSWGFEVHRSRSLPARTNAKLRSGAPL